MGSRLVLNITNNCLDLVPEVKDCYCNCYYHWSACTEGAIEELDNFLTAYEDLGDIKDVRLRCIRAFEMSGGRLSKESFSIAQELYPKEKFDNSDINRNEGIIELGDNIAGNTNAGEGLLTYDITQDKINFGDFASEETLEEYFDNRGMEIEEIENYFKQDIVNVESSVNVCEADFLDIIDLYNKIERNKNYLINGSRVTGCQY